MKTSVRNAAKVFAQFAGPFLGSMRAHSALASIENYAAFLQGRGSGSGWDIDNETCTIASCLKPKPAIIFDVGANNGEWSKRLAIQRAQPEDRHFLFECAPYCFEGIEQRTSKIPNSLLVKCAVSDNVGVSILHIPDRGSGLASLHERRDVSVVEHSYGVLEVRTDTLDNIANQNHIEFIDLLKMDIEGHELFALRGANGLLTARSIGLISFEFGSGNVNSRTYFRDFWDLLEDFNFEIRRIIPGGGTVEVSRYSETLEYFRGCTNYIALQRSIHGVGIRSV